MASSKVFLSSLTVLLIFNFIFYLITTSGELLIADLIISNLITVGIIAVVVSIIPFTGGETTVRWFLSTLIIVGIIFKQDIVVTIGVTTYTFSVGVGLGSNLINLFAGDISGLGLLPFMFFTFISLVATISGIMFIAGGD